MTTWVAGMTTCIGINPSDSLARMIYFKLLLSLPPGQTRYRGVPTGIFLQNLARHGRRVRAPKEGLQRFCKNIPVGALSSTIVYIWIFRLNVILILVQITNRGGQSVAAERVAQFARAHDIDYRGLAVVHLCVHGFL